MPCARPTHYLFSLLGDEAGCRGIAVLVFKSPLFYLLRALTLNSSDAGNSEMPTRSPKVLPTVSGEVSIVHDKIF